MIRFRHPAIALFLPTALLFAACTELSVSTAGPDAEASIRTDRDRYRAELGAVEARGDSVEVLELSIDFIFTNRSSHPVYIPTCRGVHAPRVEKRMDGEWQAVYQPPQLLCWGTPVSVDPGDRFAHSIEIRGHDPESNHHPQWEAERTDGEYRLVWNVLSAPEPDATPIPLDLRVSNTFRIEAVEPDPG